MKSCPKNYVERSRYLWTSLPDAPAKLGTMDLKSSPEVMRQFIAEGYTVSPNAVAKGEVEGFQSTLYATLAAEDPSLYVTFWDSEGKKHTQAKRELLEHVEAKLLDVHVHIPASHSLIFSPTILTFLRDVFQDEPVAFQSLYFEYGSTQGAHNDTAFVYVNPPDKFVASWIALEDIAPDSGELFYYPGSHKIDDQIFANGGKAFDGADEHAGNYSAELERIMQANNLQRETFLPKQTDVLFWSSDLVHGGSPITKRKTRRSLVTHYCPLGASIPYAEYLKREPQPVAGGGYVVGAT